MKTNQFAIRLRNGSYVEIHQDIPEWWGVSMTEACTRFASREAAQTAMKTARNLSDYGPEIVGAPECEEVEA